MHSATHWTVLRQLAAALQEGRVKRKVKSQTFRMKHEVGLVAMTTFLLRPSTFVMKSEEEEGQHFETRLQKAVN